jgi:antitoxin component YwqK of YwqJK toxin-antitoxin module
MRLNNIINKIKDIRPNIKFVGSFDENNQKTGYWEKHYKNGYLFSKGNYVNGKEDGYWEIYYTNGNLMWKGNYVNGNREGYWEIYYTNGNLMCIWNYKNGEFHEIK